MAPIRARADITLVVPKHNAQRPNAALSSVLSSVVKSTTKGAQFDSRAGHTRIGSPSKSGRNRSDSTGDDNSSSDPIKAAIESASEWNSLLLTARAERGPQWDVATQQFLVDEKSILYYDPTPLRPAPLQAPLLDDDSKHFSNAGGGAYRSRGRTRNPTQPHSSASPHPQGLPHGATPSLSRHPSHLQHPGQMMPSPGMPLGSHMMQGGMPGGGPPGTPGGLGGPFARGPIPMHMAPRTPMGGGPQPGNPMGGTPMGGGFVPPGNFYGGTPGGGGPGGVAGMPPGMSPGMGGGNMGGMGDGGMFSPMHERGRMGMPGRQMSMGNMGPGPGQGQGPGSGMGGMQDGVGGVAGFPMYGS